MPSQPTADATPSMSFADLRRRFGFRSIAIGNWVTREEQAKAAVQFQRALEDLMQLLGGPEQLVSLRGSLTLNYGTGGQPGVAAHYEPARRCLALAKNAGPGSLAHEWFHALDHYLADKAFRGVSTGTFASRAWLDNAEPIQHPLNQLLRACFHAVILSENGEHPSELFNASAGMDSQLHTHYYSKPEELCARAFEAFVQDTAPRNAFLVRGTRATREAELGLYPKPPQRGQINQAFATYFASLGRALHKTG
ncbi:hypothetical protein DES49_1563 [Halospina denitrificans]|uniref:Large polyvalent protein-associated domain-containing protein n=1 Tax=Halospina denitrificans TaxID=332522 RepID=A0A4R7JT83_9GAMM|nr:CLCA_X family protein [Halospina denitrificans]TDT41470.1 hypothetical protein DES49_1563 [Halospina denitrificans]